MRRNFHYVWDKTVILFVKQIARIIAYIWPRDRRLIAIGAWEGKRFCDSPMYLANYVLEKTDYKVVWVGFPVVRDTLPKHPRMRFVEKNSLSAFFSLLRAGTWVCCISTEWDLTTWPIEGRAKLVNTWHGYGIKRCTNGVSEKENASLMGRIVRYFGRHRRPWAMVGGEQDVDALVDGDPLWFRRDRMLRIGTPSNDFLIQRNKEVDYIQSLRTKYARLLGFDPSDKIVTYLPTWRNPEHDFFAFFKLCPSEQKQWADLLHKHHAVLIEKHHPRVIAKASPVGMSTCSIVVPSDLQQLVDVQELFLITDILISDYSGCCQDFGVLHRPCIHFMYDLDDYQVHNSGLIDGWREKLTGPCVIDKGSLFTSLGEMLTHPEFKPGMCFQETLRYQTGSACEYFVDFIKSK